MTKNDFIDKLTEEIIKLKAENAKLKKESLDYCSKGLVLEKQYEVLRRSRDKLAEQPFLRKKTLAKRT